jgi:lysophospholipase L1-like esterase
MRFLAALFLSFAASASPPAVQWDVADHGGEMVISAGSITRSTAMGPAWETARSHTSQSVGTRTVQIAIDATGTGAVMVGVANGKANISASLGANTNSVGYWSNGNTYYGGTWGGVVPGAYTTGDTIGIQADLTAHTVRFQKNGGVWSAPLSTAALGDDLYIGASIYFGSGPTVALHVVSDDWNDFAEPTLNIIAAGDSISLTSGALRTYLPRLADLFEGNRTGWARTQHLAMNGASWDYAWPPSGYPYTLTQDMPRRVAPALSFTLPNWVIAFAGTNGIAIASHPASYEYAKLQAYVSALIASGVPADHIIVPTMLPRGAAIEAARVAYNAAIVSDAGRLGYRVARLDLDPNIGIAGANTNLAWFSDGTHPTDAGHDIIARIIYAVMFP